MDTRVPYTTLFRSEVTMSMTSRYFAPLGRRTRSHGGLGPTAGIVLEALGLIPSSTARVPCGLTILLPEAGRGAEPLLMGARGRCGRHHCTGTHRRARSASFR